MITHRSTTFDNISAPLTDSIVIAMAKLVDDAMTESREPSHSDLDFLVKSAGLTRSDPKAQGQRVGKAKRVRAMLSWALVNDYPAGEKLVMGIISTLRGCGGFRAGSPNYVGQDAIRNAVSAFKQEGYELTSDGELRPRVLDNLAGRELTDALDAYVRRAQKGVADAALLAGTSKDLLEATAAHILTERFGSYSRQSNFPTLLGQAFAVLGLSTPHDAPTRGEPPQCRIDRALYEAGCGVNALRNKQGTGHGRPWLPSVTDAEARTAVELIGVIAGRLLAAHKSKP